MDPITGENILGNWIGNWKFCSSTPSYAWYKSLVVNLTKAQLLFLLMCDFTAYGDRAEFRTCDSSLRARLPQDSTLIPGMFIASWETSFVRSQNYETGTSWYTPLRGKRGWAQRMKDTRLEWVRWMLGTPINCLSFTSSTWRSLLCLGPVGLSSILDAGERQWITSKQINMIYQWKTRACHTTKRPPSFILTIWCLIFMMVL